MEALRKHTGLAVPLNMSNVDTDQIIPKQFLTRIERTGFGQFLFYNWRLDENGNKRPDFILNKPKYENASILITGENFGSGSSREHAPWSLLDYGFKVIIAPNFADIFYNNSFKNGLVPIEIDKDQVNDWLKQAEEGILNLTINLEEKTITDVERDLKISFDMPEYRRQNIMNGWDEIALTLKVEDKISAYENSVL